LELCPESVFSLLYSHKQEKERAHRQLVAEELGEIENAKADLEVWKFAEKVQK